MIRRRSRLRPGAVRAGRFGADGVRAGRFGAAARRAVGTEDTAATIWRLLKEPVEIAAIVEALVQEYEVDRAVCEREVQELVSGLIDEGLVEVRS